MSGGTDKEGNAIYRRRNGVYERLDGKPIRHRALIITSNSVTAMTPAIRASMSPLPQNGREVKGFMQRTLATDNLNDSSSGSYLSKAKRTDHMFYKKLIDGTFDTQNGGFVFQMERDKNRAYLKHNDIPLKSNGKPDIDNIINQIIPQLTPANLKQVIPANDSAIIDGVTENSNLWVYETQIINNAGDSIRTYVKLYPFHSNSGKPYMVLVSLHRTGPIRETATAAQKG